MQKQHEATLEKVQHDKSGKEKYAKKKKEKKKEKKVHKNSALEHKWITGRPLTDRYTLVYILSAYFLGLCNSAIPRKFWNFYSLKKVKQGLFRPSHSLNQWN